jgi:hypothetical protein
MEAPIFVLQAMEHNANKINKRKIQFFAQAESIFCKRDLLYAIHKNINVVKTHRIISWMVFSKA